MIRSHQKHISMGRKNSMVMILFLFIFFLPSCKHTKIEVIYYEGTKQIKEQRQFFFENDTSYYEYTSYYLNGQMKTQGMLIDQKKEGMWKEWYGDGMLHRDLYYVDGELDLKNENRKLPEVIFESDSLFLDVETRMKVLHIYPDELMPFAGMFLQRLTDDSCYDYRIIPWTTDSVYIFYFSPILFDKIDTIYLKDIHTPERLKLTNKEFEELKEFNPDLKIPSKRRKMITLKKTAVYER